MASVREQGQPDDQYVNTTWKEKLHYFNKTLKKGTCGDHTYTWFGIGCIIIDADLEDCNENGEFHYHGDAEGFADAIYNHVADSLRFHEGVDAIHLCTTCKDAIMNMFRRHNFAVELRTNPSPQYSWEGRYFTITGWNEGEAPFTPKDTNK